jgi:hypothetical protein
MTKINGAGVSLASLNARVAGEVPFKFAYVGPDGNETGIIFEVIGGHSETVQNKVNSLLNEKRRQEAIREASANPARPGDAAIPIEDDIAFTQRLAAVRLVGWSGITDPWTPELAYLLCSSNPDIADQVLKASNKLSNFMKASAPA